MLSGSAVHCWLLLYVPCYLFFYQRSFLTNSLSSNYYTARILLFVSHQGPIRRDRAQHLQEISNFWKRHLNVITCFFIVYIIALFRYKWTSRRFSSRTRQLVKNRKKITTKVPLSRSVFHKKIRLARTAALETEHFAFSHATVPLLFSFFSREIILQSFFRFRSPRLKRIRCHLQSTVIQRGDA